MNHHWPRCRPFAGVFIFFLAAAAPLGGCAVERPAATRSEAAVAGIIPFAQAEVVRFGKGFDIGWQAPAARTVTVLAGLRADGTDGRVVASGGPSDRVRIKDLDPARRWYFTLRPNAGAPLTIADRSLGLSSAPNFRDLGGYRTKDGRWVKMGMLYRSDQMNRLTDPDLDRIAGLDIGLVADLRNQDERAREPDRLPTRAEHLVLDVMATGSPDGAGIEGAQTLIAAGRGAEFMELVYQDLVTRQSARQAYEGLFDRIAEAPRNIVYHCTAGKDRTGWASAVLLMALGVPRETVIADFLASNLYLEGKNEAYYAAAEANGAKKVREVMSPVNTVRREYLETAFATVETRYGSFDAYLVDGIGVDRTELERLRAHYLAGRPIP